MVSVLLGLGLALVPVLLIVAMFVIRLEAEDLRRALRHPLDELRIAFSGETEELDEV